MARKMTKRQFEDYFKEEVIPIIQEKYEQDGTPDRPARREAWNDTVDYFIQDGELPESAYNWSHPRWLETYQAPHGRRYYNPIQRLRVFADSDAEAERRGRKFGRVVDVRPRSGGEYLVIVDQERLYNPESCGPGQVLIRREGYQRKPYKRKDGTLVEGTYVPPTEFCIEDPGKPGIRSRGAKSGPYAEEKPWIQREGKLGGPGYTSKSAKERHKILDKCVKQYGYRSCLGSIMVLLRDSEISSKVRKKLDSDKKYLEKNYGGPGSFGPRSNNPCCASCAKGLPCEGCGSGHPRGCGCPDCRGLRVTNPTPSSKALKRKLLK